jgi:hypothetical protein
MNEVNHPVADAALRPEGGCDAGCLAHDGWFIHRLRSCGK